MADVGTEEDALKPTVRGNRAQYRGHSGIHNPAYRETTQ